MMGNHICNTSCSILSRNSGPFSQSRGNVRIIPSSEFTSELDKRIIRKRDKEQKKFLYQCEYCSGVFMERRHFLNHLKTHTIQINYQCSICRKTFNSYKHAEAHWATECSNGEHYLPTLTYCQVCDRKFQSRGALYAHKLNMKHFTPKRQRNNPENEELLSVDSDEQKLVIVVDDHKFQCECCILVFDDMDKLILHRRTSHSIDYICEECGIQLTNLGALNIHYMIHRIITPHVCTQCGLAFHRTSQLTKHAEVHQYISPFECPYEGCSYICTAKKTFVEHNKLDHFCNISLQCADCKKWFYTTYYYNQHLYKTIKRPREEDSDEMS